MYSVYPIWIHLRFGCQPKNKGIWPPKWMVKIMENPIKMDDLGVALFLETPIFRSQSNNPRHEKGAIVKKLPNNNEPYKLTNHQLCSYASQWIVATSVDLIVEVAKPEIRYCWCFRDPKQPPGMVLKPVVNKGINYQSQLVSLPDFERTINSIIIREICKDYQQHLHQVSWKNPPQNGSHGSHDPQVWLIFRPEPSTVWPTGPRE